MIDEQERDRIREAAGPVSDRLLRDVLRESGKPLAPMVEGVRQDSFGSLERTLLGLAQTYRERDTEGRRECRKLVIAAKDHAKLVAASPNTPEPKQAQKKEMVLWLLTWLENPDVFETWVALRKKVLGNEFDGLHLNDVTVE